MTNSNIIKLAGILAVISMLFLPMAGCGTFTFSGLDIIKSSGTESVSDKVAGNVFGVDTPAPTSDNTIKILLIAAVVMGVLVIILKRKSQVFFASIVGIVLLVGAYVYMKSSLSAKGNSMGGLNDDNSNSNLFGMDASDMIELKSGAYLAVISFLIAAFIARSKKELIAPQSTPPAENTTDTNRPPGTN